MKNEKINLDVITALSKLCDNNHAFGTDKIKLDAIHATATNGVALAHVAILREPVAPAVLVQPEQILKPSITITDNQLGAVLTLKEIDTFPRMGNLLAKEKDATIKINLSVNNLLKVLKILKATGVEAVTLAIAPTEEDQETLTPMFLRPYLYDKTKRFLPADGSTDNDVAMIMPMY